MDFLTKGEFFKGYSRAAVLCVFSDRVVAHIVEKGNGPAKILHSATEPQEDPSGGALLADAVVLNCQKALQALPAGARAGVTHCIAALSSASGMYFFVRAQGIREDKEKKITQEELGTVVSKWYGAGDAAAVAFRNIPQRAWVDGFAVPDAAGLNGKEISLDIACMAADASFARAFAEFASAAGMQCAGFTDLRAAAGAYSGFFQGNDSALITVVGEKETNVLLVREKALAGIGTLNAGYGILRLEIARVYGVGKEEARNVAERVRAGTADEGFVRQAADAWRTAIAEGTKKLGAAVSAIDPSRLLPGTVWIAAMEHAPDWYEALRDGKWLSGLPLERNARVRIAAEKDQAENAALWQNILLEYL